MRSTELKNFDIFDIYEVVVSWKYKVEERDGTWAGGVNLSVPCGYVKPERVDPAVAKNTANTVNILNYLLNHN